MKINGLKVLIIFALFIFSANGASAACSWTAKQTVFGGAGTTPIDTGGCNISETTESDVTKCDALAKPAESGDKYTTNYSVCCCDKNVSVTQGSIEKTLALSASGTPKFKLPDYVFQIPIGTLSKLNTVDCSGGTCKIPFISQYISAVYDYGLSVAGVLGVLMLMAAGLLWLVSGGDSGKITKAKQMIFGSITGLLLLVGLSVFLSYINPDLIKNKSIEIANIERIDILGKMASSRNGATAENFKNSGCATDTELKTGVDFYATGYYKPAYNKSDPNFFCVVGMQCSCPNGTDSSKVCAIYKNTYPNYHPCATFEAGTPYCNMTSSGSAPQMGDIAGPKCNNLPSGTKVCFKGKTYTITDSGGGIKGKRIDIWSGNDLNQAYANTGTGKLTIGACK